MLSAVLRLPGSSTSGGPRAPPRTRDACMCSVAWIRQRQRCALIRAGRQRQDSDQTTALMAPDTESQNERANSPEINPDLAPAVGGNIKT